MSKKSTLLDAIEQLYAMQFESRDVAFIFLGYSGVILRTKEAVIAFDPGKALGPSEISALEYLDLLCITHNHWDHFNLELTTQLCNQTNAHVIADSISVRELTDNLPTEQLTIGKSNTSGASYETQKLNVFTLPGIHVGPLNQYLVDIGGLRIYHGGDSRYWRHKNQGSDIAFVPTGTATTCAPGVALAMVMNMQPKIVVAIHGNRQDMIQFRDLMTTVMPEKQLIIPERFKVIRITS